MVKFDFQLEILEHPVRVYSCDRRNVSMASNVAQYSFTSNAGHEVQVDEHVEPNYAIELIWHEIIHMIWNRLLDHEEPLRQEQMASIFGYALGKLWMDNSHLADELNKILSAS